MAKYKIKSKAIYKKAKEIVARFARKERVRGVEFLAIYNSITGKREVNSSCSSCNIKRLNLIKLMLEEWEKENPPTEAKVDEAPKTDAAKPKKRRGRPPKKKS